MNHTVLMEGLKEGIKQLSLNNFVHGTMPEEEEDETYPGRDTF